MNEGGADIATLGLRLDGRQMDVQAAASTAKLNALGAAGMSANKIMMALGVTMTAGMAFMKIAKDAGEFAGALQQSLAIMGDVSDEMKGKMSDAARKVGVELNLGATKAAESYYFLASAGMTAAQSVAAMPAVAAFAKAGMFDMATATDLATDAQSALGLRSADTAENLANLIRVTDVLVKANTMANASVEQFATSLTSEAGAALKSYGKDIEEGIGVLAAFADQGVKAEQAGTGLSRILRLMGSAAVNNAEAYEKLGVAVFDGNDEMRNMADIVEDLENALIPMADKTRIAALEALGFQARVQGVIMPLLGASDAMREYEASARQAAGMTDEVAGKQMLAPFERLGKAMKTFSDRTLEAGNAILRVLVPALEVAARHVEVLVEAFKLLIGLAVGRWFVAVQAGMVAKAAAAATAAAATKAEAAASVIAAEAALVLARTEHAAAVALEMKAKAEYDAAVAAARLAVVMEGLVVTQEMETNALARQANALRALLPLQAKSAVAAEALAVASGQVAVATTAAAVGEKAAAAGATVMGVTMAGAGTIGTAMWTAIGGPIGLIVIGIYAVSKAFDWMLGRMEKANELSTEEEARYQRLNAQGMARAATWKAEADAEKERLKAWAAAQAAQEEAVGKAVRAGQIELARMQALNDAYSGTAHELALLNLEYDRQAELLGNAEEYSDAELKAMNGLTNAMHQQKVKALELATAAEQLQELRDVMKELAEEAASNALAHASQLESLEAQVRAEAAKRKELQGSKTAVIDLAEAEEMLAAVRRNPDDPAQIAREQQLIRTKYALIRANRELAGSLEMVAAGEASLEDLATKAREPWIQAARNIQDALSAAFQTVYEDGLKGFRDMATGILDVFVNLASQIAAAMVADKLGITKMLADVQDPGISLGSAAKNLSPAIPAVGIGVGIVSVIGGYFEQAKQSQAFHSRLERERLDRQFEATEKFVNAVQSFADAVGGTPSSLSEDFEKVMKLWDAANTRRTKPQPRTPDPAEAEAERLRLLDTYEARLKEINTQMQEELDVRELLAQGMDIEAGRRQLEITQRREWDEAVKAEWDDATMNRLAYVQGIEKEKAALAEAAKAHDFRTELFATEQEQGGNPIGAMVIRMEEENRKLLADAQKLVDAGLITPEEFARYAKTLDTKLADAVRDASAQLEATRNEFMANLTSRQQTLAGDDRGALETGMRARGVVELAGAQELADAGIITQEAVTALAAVIEGELLDSLEAWDEAIKQIVTGMQTQVDVWEQQQLGTDAGDREAIRIQMQADADAQIAYAQALLDAGKISQGLFDSWVNMWNGKVNQALKEFDEGLLETADALAEANKKFAAMQSLRVRMLVAQGNEEGAQALRNSIELHAAITDGRGAEYVMLLQQVQAEEAKAKAMEKTTSAIEETTKAANQLAQALNSPEGVRLSLDVWRASLYNSGGPVVPGQDSVGQGVAVLPGAAGGASGETVYNTYSFDGITIKVEKGMDGQEVLDSILDAAAQGNRAGGQNPFLLLPT